MTGVLPALLFCNQYVRRASTDAIMHEVTNAALCTRPILAAGRPEFTIVFWWRPAIGLNASQTAFLRCPHALRKSGSRHVNAFQKLRAARPILAAGRPISRHSVLIACRRPLLMPSRRIHVKHIHPYCKFDAQLSMFADWSAMVSRFFQSVGKHNRIHGKTQLSRQGELLHRMTDRRRISCASPGAGFSRSRDAESIWRLLLRIQRHLPRSPSKPAHLSFTYPQSKAARSKAVDCIAGVTQVVCVTVPLAFRKHPSFVASRRFVCRSMKPQQRRRVGP